MLQLSIEHDLWNIKIFHSVECVQVTHEMYIFITNNGCLKEKGVSSMRRSVDSHMNARIIKFLKHFNDYIPR